MDMLSDAQRQDQERTHQMDKDDGEGFQKDHREKIELVREHDEERRRTHTEESVADGYTREIKKGRPKTMEERVPSRHENHHEVTTN